MGVPRAGSRLRARPRLRPSPARPSRPLGPTRASGLALERVGDQRGPNLLQAIVDAHGRTRRRVRAVLPVASRPLRSRVQRRHRPRCRLLSARRGQPSYRMDGGRFLRHDRYLAAFTHATHTSVVLWQLPLGNTLPQRHLGSLPRQPRAVVAGGPQRRPPAGDSRRRRDRTAVRRRRGGHDERRTDGGLFNRLARGYERRRLGL